MDDLTHVAYMSVYRHTLVAGVDYSCAYIKASKENSRLEGSCPSLLHPIVLWCVVRLLDIDFQGGHRKTGGMGRTYQWSVDLGLSQYSSI